MINLTFTDIEVSKVMGIDFEPSDVDVGIMSPSFTLVFKDEKNHQYQLYMGEDQFLELLRITKPFQEEEDSRE